PRLKSAKPVSVNGLGDLSSQAQKDVRGRFRALKWPFRRRNPSSSDSGASKRTRSISNPLSAATPAGYGATPPLTRDPPSANGSTSAICFGFTTETSSPHRTPFASDPPEESSQRPPRLCGEGASDSVQHVDLQRRRRVRGSVDPLRGLLEVGLGRAVDID